MGTNFRGRHLKRYGVISIMLHYMFTLLHNAYKLFRSVNATIIYRSGHIFFILNKFIAF